MAEGKYTELGKILKIYADRIVEGLRANLDKDRPHGAKGIMSNSNASHSLWQSIQPDVKLYGSKYDMKIYADKYWQIVDQGIRGNKSSAYAPKSKFQYKNKLPPIEPIIKWTSQKALNIGAMNPIKKGAISSLKNKKIKKGLKQLDEASRRRSFAYAIAKKIQTDGVRPTNFYSDFINPAFKEELKADIIKATRQDIIIQIKG